MRKWFKEHWYILLVYTLQIIEIVLLVKFY
jgi:hypothetical protein